MSKSHVMTGTAKPYIPAAGRQWLLPIYDFVTSIMGIERVRGAILDTAPLQPGQTVLDIGSGTGTMAIAIKRRSPGVSVTGLDPDPDAIARAERKAKSAGAAIDFVQGYADALPFPDASFDRVLSSFMYHHLSQSDKPKLFLEVRRVLKLGGTFDFIDFGGPEFATSGFWPRIIHRQHVFQDNAESRIVGLMQAAGLRQSARVAHLKLLLSHAVHYRATRGSE